MTSTADLPLTDGSTPRPPRSARHGAAFWAVAAVFLASMSFSTAPTPLWALYQHRDGFSTFMISVAFAAYAVGVLISLFFLGHLSDRLGRRTVLLPAVALEIVSAVGFIFWNDLLGLIVARVVSGVAVGMLTATTTAFLLELHFAARPGHDRTRADLVSTAVNLGGLGIGPLVAGILAEFAPAPLITPYVVFLVLLVLALVAVALAPETVTDRGRLLPYHPQRVRVPSDGRGRYFAAATVSFASFSVLGLFTSLAPSFMAGQLHVTSRTVLGLVVFLTYAASVGAQLVTRRIRVRRQVLLGLALALLGTASLVVGVVASLFPAFLAGGILTGAGGGILLRVAIATGSQLVPPQYRGEAIAGIFLAGYVGLSVPVLGLGIFATFVTTLQVAIAVFAVIVGVLITVASIALARRS